MRRNLTLDILKLVMACMVVGLHVGFLGDVSQIGTYLTENGLFRMAVPIFLMVNGFYFYPVLSKNRSFSWLKRVFILYVVWMSIYSYFWFFIPEGSIVDIAKLFRKFVMGYHHLWYLSGMMGAAIILMAVRNYSSRVLGMSIVLTFCAGVLIQYLGNYHLFEGTLFDSLFNYDWAHRNMLLFSYPFFCMGYLIHRNGYHQVVTRKQAGVGCMIGLILLLGESYVNYYQTGGDQGFDNYMALLLVCPAVFIFCIRSTIYGKSKEIALYSSAIYFIHILLYDLLRDRLGVGPTALTGIVIATSVVASYFIILLNKKVKILL